MLTRAAKSSRPAIAEPLRRFNTIGRVEAQAATRAIMTAPLSGYLGGELRGGHYVEMLERAWEEVFNVRHAVAVNSATSGLLVACMAARVGPGDKVIVPAMTMSATAAAPAFLGADILFGDVNDETFDLDEIPDLDAKAVIPVSLFGHPACVHDLMRTFDKHATIIEDCSQAILASNEGRYAGTISHIGVFSLNVHKHLQCGEGGICVTNDEALADRMRLGRNHGELVGKGLGLNLRMTEVTAAIALQQLIKAPEIVTNRRMIAEEIIDAARPLFDPPDIRDGCTHNYYMIAWKGGGNRKSVVEALNAEGFPAKEGYVEPLYHLPTFSKSRCFCPVAEQLHNEELVTYENCAYAPTPKQLKQIRTAFKKVADAITV